MYRLIVVDDEHDSRELMVSIIAKTNQYFSVVGEFKNGFEALSFINENDVNVVITDIKMPIMDGIGLSEAIHKNHPNIKVVILSGFGEFEYAKKAIEYNVINYLLKPMDIKELSNTLLRIKSILDKENNNKLDTFYNENREAFFVDVCVGAFESKEEMINRFNELNLPIDVENTSGCILEVELEEFSTLWKYGRETLKTAIQNLLSNHYLQSYYFFNKPSGFLYICFSENTIDTMLLEMQIKELFSISNNVRILTKFNSVLSIDSNTFMLKDKLELFVSHILEDNNKICVNLVNNIISSIGNNNSISDLLNSIENLPIKSLLSSGIFDLNKYSELVADESFIYTKKNINNDVFNKVYQYIEEHYSEDLTRDDVAQFAFMNSSYFSRFFKKHTGISFSDYLIDLRIKKSIKFLETDMNIDDICYKVGYGSRANFTRNFKLITTYTPSQYRKAVLKK